MQVPSLSVFAVSAQLFQLDAFQQAFDPQAGFPLAVILFPVPECRRNERSFVKHVVNGVNQLRILRYVSFAAQHFAAADFGALRRRDESARVEGRIALCAVVRNLIDGRDLFRNHIHDLAQTVTYPVVVGVETVVGVGFVRFGLHGFRRESSP